MQGGGGDLMTTRSEPVLQLLGQLCFTALAAGLCCCKLLL